MFRRFSLPALTLTRINTDDTLIEIPEEQMLTEEVYQTDTLTAEEFAKLVGIEIKEEESIHSTCSFPKLDMSIFTPPTERINPFDMNSLSQSLPDQFTSHSLPEMTQLNSLTIPSPRRRLSDCRVEKKGRFTVEKQVITVTTSSRFEIMKESRARLSSVDSGIEINDL